MSSRHISVEIAADPTGSIRESYAVEEVDAVGIYCEEVDGCYLLPIELVGGQLSVQLRLAPARNGQRAALHFAEDYRLGAVAQLEERRNGIAEARGSNPLSSTAQNGARAAAEEVGANQFRNHFGYYLERAAAGSEILIRRRGRRFAQLGPLGVG